MSKLKPCPFCGNDGRVYHPHEDEEKWAVICRMCSCDTCHSSTRLKAVTAWNTRAESIPPKSSMSEWQPIETAPKDATFVILYGIENGTDTQLIGFWDSDHRIWFADKFRRTYMPNPTHWMPLPHAPSESIPPHALHVAKGTEVLADRIRTLEEPLTYIVDHAWTASTARSDSVDQ
jgi:hypothetical protein